MSRGWVIILLLAVLSAQPALPYSNNNNKNCSEKLDIPVRLSPSPDAFVLRARPESMQYKFYISYISYFCSPHAAAVDCL